jgi:predicted PurR-regulated permease PerM
MENKSINININTKTLVNMVWIGAIVYALIKIKSIILIILTSVVIASFIGTSATYVKQKLNINRSLAVALMYVLTVGVFSLVFYFFIPVLLKEIANIVPLVSQFIPTAQDATIGGINIGTIGDAGDLANEIVGKAPISDVAQNIGSLLNTVSSGFVSTLSAFFGGIANILLVAVVSFYLSISKDGIPTFLKIITPVQSEEYVINLWERAQKKIALWMSGQVVLGLIIGVLTFIGLSILEVEYALLLAVVAGLFELIPFGIFLAAIPAVTLAFASGGLPLALMVVGLYIIIQQLEGYLIAPLVVQKATGISPLVVILSVLIGINLAGFWGLILAIPVAVTILEYIKDLEIKKEAELKRLKENQNV